MTDPRFDRLVLLGFRTGSDTLDLARMFRIPEAAIYNALARARSAERRAA
jgi:hypothetical protein